MTKFFNILKKNPVFVPFFPIFWAKKKKKKNPENPALSHTTSYRFLASCQNLEKTNDKRKRLDRR